MYFRRFFDNQDPVCLVICHFQVSDSKSRDAWQALTVYQGETQSFLNASTAKLSTLLFFNNYQETSLESRQDKTLLGLSLTTVQIRKGQGWIQQALTRLALPHPSLHTT